MTLNICHCWEQHLNLPGQLSTEGDAESGAVCALAGVSSRMEHPGALTDQGLWLRFAITHFG